MTDAQDTYKVNFGMNSVYKSDTKKLEAAFKQASDIRKFEIDLYWKRAGYFWALIAVSFAGYFAILSSACIPNKHFLSFIVATIGFVFTFAWYLVNRGSKYWQENWENHLDLLEDEITGPLYKTRLERPEENDFFEKYVTGPRSVSVSKVNQLVNVYVLSIWVVLCIYSSTHSYYVIVPASYKWLVICAYIAVAAIAILFCFTMYGKKGGTHQKNHSPNMRVRKTAIAKELKEA